MCCRVVVGVLQEDAGGGTAGGLFTLWTDQVYAVVGLGGGAVLVMNRAGSVRATGQPSLPRRPRQT